MGGLNHAIRPVHNPAVDSVLIDRDVLLYDGQLLRLLAGTAASIWRAIDGGTSARELLVEIAAGDTDVERDVAAFLDYLVEQKLILAPPADDAARYIVGEHVAHVVDESQTLLLDLRTGKRQALSESAGVIWRVLCTDPDPRTVAAELRQTYPDEPTSVVFETARLLDELAEAGFLIRHPGTCIEPTPTGSHP